MSAEKNEEKSRALLALEEALSPHERGYLLSLSRKTLNQCAAQAALPTVPEADQSSGLLIENHCFVTLRIGAVLRGCIGSIGPHEFLYKRVIESTKGAAMEDPRFEPVSPDEVNKIDIGISVLTDSRALHYENVNELLGLIIPFKHGVIIRKGWQAATYLPQVWNHVEDKERFLSELCIKARLHPDAWRDLNTTVEVFESLSFGEKY